jgi:hypothetical protein
VTARPMVTAIRQASSSWNGRAFFRRPIRNPINLLTYMCSRRNSSWML